MATYVIADLKFFDDEQRKKMGYVSFAQMNADIIRNWNKTIDKDDTVIIMGDNGGGSYEQMESVFSQLNGKFTFISYDMNDRFTKKQWRAMGFIHFWSVSMYQTLADGREIIYVNKPINTPKAYARDYALVVVDSQNPIEGMSEGNRLSVDAAKWQYCPLNTAELLTIYNNMKEWEDMTDGTEKRTDIKED